jgi:hypothetical protein
VIGMTTNRERPPWWVKRPGTVYEVTTVHERTGRLVRGYRGKTRLVPYTKRIEQHKRLQRWGDLIVTSRVLAEGNWNGLQLWWAEVWRIVLGWPIYNRQWNLLNPRRIRVYVAAERNRTPACRATLRDYHRARAYRERRFREGVR